MSASAPNLSIANSDDHIEIFVKCAGPEPVALAIKMTKPDTFVVPIRALHLYCESISGKPA